MTIFDWFLVYLAIQPFAVFVWANRLGADE